VKRALFLAAVAAVVVFSVGPLLWQIITSIKPDAELTRIPPFLPVRPTGSHYAAVLREPFFLRVIANSTVVASVTTLLSIAFGTLAAFGLAKLTVPGKAVILVFVLGVSLFPPIATVSPLYLVIRALGLRDTWTALIATYTSFSLPLTIWVLTSFFRSIPDELYSSARVDGCSPFQAFRYVLLPLAAPGVFTTAVLVFIFSWNEFLFALTFTATEASRTIPVAIALFPGLHEVPWGDISAASVVVTLPLLLLVFLFQRRIVEGLTAGAVKG
jgi:multiple sugar transport system permease protein